jgi:DNA polymerase-1
MIYVVSDKIDISGMTDVQPMTVDESLSVISEWPVVQFDTETTGLDPRVCSLTSMQFGYKDYKTGKADQIVVDCKSINPEAYKNALENAYLVGHNLKFDLQFLYNYSIVPLKVYDTMICEQVLYLGYSSEQVSMSLANVLKRYTGEDLDKTFQKQIAKRGLTKEGILYSANDVVYLQDIRKAQLQVAESRNCKKAFIVENRFVPAIAYLEWCGIHLDEEKWKAKMENDQKYLDECLEKLNRYVVTHTLLKDKFVSSYTQLDLFQQSDTTLPSCSVNWDSPSQVVSVCLTLGFNTKTFDKKTKKEKDSVEEKQLSVQKGIDDEFLKLYLDYKGAVKTVSSYGQGHLNLINPDTGRLHTQFKQIGTVTGRMSSGSTAKNRDLAIRKGLKANDVGFVNLQNLPARGKQGEITRACFTSEPRNVFISSDFSSEESRVQADVWNEKTLLDAFANGVDTHNLYAKLCFPDELKDVDVKDVKKVRPDLRQAAKSAEFAVGYGSDGSSIAATIGMPIEKAKDMVAGILKGMPGMASYKKKTGKFLKDNGYIIINPITGHRVYWPEWSQWKAVEDTFTTDFWNDYKAFHQGTNDAVCKKVRKHMKEGHEWFGKNVLNYPIQGGSAVVLKQAAADLFEWVVKHGYFNKILFCVFVHDELDVECPKKIAEKFAKVMEKTMEDAAAMYYHKLKIPSESSIGLYWIH